MAPRHTINIVCVCVCVCVSVWGGVGGGVENPVCTNDVDLGLSLPVNHVKILVT